MPKFSFPPIIFLAAQLSVCCGSVLHAETPAKASFTQEGKQVILRTSSGKEIGRYQAEPGKLPRADIPVEFTRGGYLHPLQTPAGVRVTDDYAVGHIHHHGVWTAWTKTAWQGRQPDFWNMGQKKGRMEFGKVTVENNSLQAIHYAVDMLATPEQRVLEETWKLTASSTLQPVAAQGVQLTSIWKNLHNQPLDLPEYHYGGLGFRGRAEWNGEPNLRVLTSEGITDRLKANTSRAKWCWLGGLVEGKIVGALLMDHPSNFRHPQPMRIHPKEPFFCYAPQQLGAMSITKEQPYTMRYQVLLMDGEPDAKAIETLWQAYITP